MRAMITEGMGVDCGVWAGAFRAELSVAARNVGVQRDWWWWRLVGRMQLAPQLPSIPFHLLLRPERLLRPSPPQYTSVQTQYKPIAQQFEDRPWISPLHPYRDCSDRWQHWQDRHRSDHLGCRLRLRTVWVSGGAMPDFDPLRRWLSTAAGRSRGMIWRWSLVRGVSATYRGLMAICPAARLRALLPA